MKTKKIKKVELRFTEDEIKEKFGLDKALSLRFCDMETIFKAKEKGKSSEITKELYMVFEEVK